MPLISIEIVMVFGGVLAFGWWQLRSVSKDQAAAAATRCATDPSATGTEWNAEPAMNDSTSGPAKSAIGGPLDPGRIHADDPADVRHWCDELKCAEADLRRAVAEVGEHVTAVRKFLSAGR